MTNVLLHRPELGPGDSRIGVRVRALLSASALDRCLLAGADLNSDPALAHRARHLGSRGRRRQLSGGLRRVLEDPRPGAISSRAPANRAAIRAARHDLIALADELDGPREVDVRGILLTRRLLSDVTGPLFAPEHDIDLAHAARRARRALR